MALVRGAFIVNPEPIVFVVDDDDAVRQALCLLIKSAGIEVEAYKSADEFL